MRRLRSITSVLALALALAVTGLSLAPAQPLAAQPPCGDTVTVQPGDTLWRIANICQTSMPQILAVNPGITNPNLIFPGQVLQMPAPATPPPPPEQPNGVLYTVQPGDWLADIARRHQVSLASLLAVNPQLETPGLIVPGQQIVVPTTEVLPELGPTPPAPPPGGFMYTVQSGEWLLAIARRFGVSLPTLLAANPQIVNPARIFPGQRIVIPATETLPELGPGTELPEGFMYTVEPGDRLFAIANRFGLSLPTLLAANPQITNPNLIFPGQQIRIPLAEEGLPETGEELFTDTILYMVAVGDAGARGLAFGCDDSLIPVAINIEPTVAPLRGSLERLLGLNNPEFFDTGLYNALAASNLQVQSVNIANRTAIIALTGTLMPGGVCDYPRIEYQLRYTAIRFDTVDNVQITVNGTPLGDLLTEQ
jgi:LysM repeat protein